MIDSTLDTLRTHFATVTDPLGTPIDVEIFELVILLNALGIPTRSSCAGHECPDSRVILMPCINLGVENDVVYRCEARRVGLYHLIRGVQWTRSRITYTNGYTAALDAVLTEAAGEIVELNRQMEEIQAPSRGRLAALLADFYHCRSVPQHQRLVLVETPGASQAILSLVGASHEYHDPDEQARSLLRVAQSEMEAFSLFLAEVYRQGRLSVGCPGVRGESSGLTG